MPVLATKTVTKDVTALVKSISVVIPAYNDETTIGKLVADTHSLLTELKSDFEIIVLNDGSKDNTWDAIKNLPEQFAGVRAMNHEQNLGFGRTITELYYAGCKDLVCFLPGDYQFSPSAILEMAQGLHKYDFVIGHRVKRNDPPRRLFQSAVYNFILRVLYGCPLKDINSVKLFRREVLANIKLESETSFVDAELPIKVWRKGYGVGEVPVTHLPRLSPGANGGRLSIVWDTFKDSLSLIGRL